LQTRHFYSAIAQPFWPASNASMRCARLIEV
jgi:hypothetical protein